MAALANVMRTEAEKRRARMQQAVAKGYFRLLEHYTVHTGSGRLEVYAVWSCQTHRRNPRVYLVSRDGTKGWTCTCPDFAQNGRWLPCKHILYVQSRGL